MLESNPTSKDGVCYINLSHCHFYPDPDHSGIWLQNSSTSKHSAQNWSLQSQFYEILSGQCVPLRPGTWILNLGEGLRFLLHIASPEEVHSLSMNITSQTSGINRKKSNAGSRTALPKSRGEAKIMMDNQKAAKQSLMPPQEPPDKVSASQGGEIIGHTEHSRVERGSWAGKSVAIKVCRRPEVPVAANMWRQEVQALRILSKHVSYRDYLNPSKARLTCAAEYSPNSRRRCYKLHHNNGVGSWTEPRKVC